MFEFLRTMYRLGRLDAGSLRPYVAAGRITQGQYREIVGEVAGNG